MKILRHLAIAGLLVLVGYALDCRNSRNCRRHAEDLLDDTLDDSFPASDPPSSQDFSSPHDREMMRRGKASPA